MAIRASKTGVISFYFRYKLNGCDKRVTLGNYPLITLKMAKDEAMRLALVYQQGGSVVDVANTRYNSQDHLPTVKECVDSYLKTYSNLLRPSSLTMYRSTLEKHLAPYFDRPAEKISMSKDLGDFNILAYLSDLFG
ncbi:integrase arm-type DNA-binding domain-containing protein [Rheinheimera sp.]|uniref:integrase arm-type DNA-binding domain-containing protein n=1 Tax=Rheinheimera sp. TaxID=1869214 RepID=UPI00345E167E